MNPASLYSVKPDVSGFPVSIPNTTEGSLPVQPDVAQSFKHVVAQQRFL